jgi:AraC family transcriptional activator of pobA
MAKVIPTYDICTIKPDKHSSNELLVSRFAPYLKVHSGLCKAHRHNFYHLIYFTKGGGTHNIDFVNFKVTPGEIYFMTPGQVHSWNFKGEADGYVINFSELFFRSFLADPNYLEQFSFFLGSAEQCVVFLPVDAQRQVKMLLEKILEAANGDNSFNKDLIKLWLLELFMITAAHTQVAGGNKEAKGNHIVISSFKKLVEEKYLELHLPKDYAALLFVTPNYLNNLCKQILGKPAGEIIRDRILLEAKRLLVNNGMHISEIANHLNFTDHSHFSKFFKKASGETPESFRKSIMNP